MPEPSEITVILAHQPSLDAPGPHDVRRELAALVACREALSRGGTACVFAVNRPDLARGLRDAGLDAVLWTDPGDPSLLPSGARAAADALLSRGASPHALCLVARTPAPDTLAQDLARLAADWGAGGKRALASLTRPVDHPCQLEKYYNIQGLGFVHLFDQSGSCAPDGRPDHYVSTPFAGLPFLPDQSPGSGQGLFGNKADASALDPEHAPIIRDGQHLRVLFSKQRLDVLAAGLGFNGPTEPVGCTRFQSGRPARLFLFASRARWFATLLDQTREELIVTMDLTLRGETETLPYRVLAGQWVEIPPQPPGPGIFFSTLLEAEPGHYTMTLGVPTVGAPWRRVEGGLMNLDAGTMVYGRQNFPECFEVDGRYILTRLADVPRFDELLARGLVRGVALRDEA